MAAIPDSSLKAGMMIERRLEVRGSRFEVRGSREEGGLGFSGVGVGFEVADEATDESFRRFCLLIEAIEVLKSSLEGGRPDRSARRLTKTCQVGDHSGEFI
jgi:hypothetical protein